MTDPRHALARIPGWSGPDVFIDGELGGLTNRSFRIRRGGELAVLRLDAPHTAAFGLDRERELSVLTAAAASRLAPEVLFADTPNGILLSRFVDGSVWTRDDLRRPAALEALAAALQRVHRLPLSGQRVDHIGIVRRYLAGLRADKALYRTGRAVARCVERIVSETGPLADLRCCHNDVVASNIVGRDTPMLLDWEYASDNDPLFDLASVIAYHRLDVRAANLLLGAYAGDATGELSERLVIQCRLHDALHWLWLAVRETISPAPDQARRLTALGDRLRVR